MKKVFILFLILVVGKGFSQSAPIYTSNCSSGGSFSLLSSDWIIDNSLVYPTCTVLGSSGADKLVAQQANTGTMEEARTTAINTSTFVNIQVSWNMLRATATSPALTFQWSNDLSTWNTISFTAPSIAVWGSVTPVSLPAAASGTIIYVRWTYTSNGDFNDYVGIDDINVSGTPSPSYYWNGVGPLHDPAQWGTNTNGTGGALSDFTTPNQNFYIRNASTATLVANWTISGSGSILNIGDGTVPNSNNLTIPTTFALTITGGAKLNVTNNSTLTIQNSTFPSSSDVTLGSNSTVNYAQPSATVPLWVTTYGNLILSGSGNRNQGNGSTIVTGSFVVGSSINYVMANSPASSTQLMGPISCAGNISTALSNLSISGSSVNPIGTINFNGSNILNNLILNRAGQTLTLGSSIGFSGALSQVTQFTNGNVNLNGKTITFSGPVTFPASTSNGVIIGSSTSGISIAGSGAITNSLLMDQSTAAARTAIFTMNRASTTLNLGTDFIANAPVFTNGNVNINGKLLTLNGLISFPAAVSNGVLIGSTTSSLTISGTGAVTNALLMDQTSNASKSLGSFINNKLTEVFALGNNLIVSGTGSFLAGILDLNGTLLTLSGPITFPTGANFSRGFKGSSTSSLTIDGTGAITNALYMNSANITLDQLIMNRNGETLTLGNSLETYGSVYPNDGTIASAGNLFIRSNATNKGRIAPVLGALTGNIKVETFALGGNTDWTNLGVSGVSGQTFANWDGQIPMSCSLCINNETSAGGYFVSIQGWDETAAASSSLAYVEQKGTDPLNVGEGYWVFLGNSLGTTSDITWTVSGAPVIGPVPVSLSYSGPSNGDGYNLISNPFPSPISWDNSLASQGTNSNNINGAIYVYNPDVVGGTTSYVNGVGSSDANGITDNVPMGQGFYVQVAAPLTFTFNESNKVKSNAPLLKTTNNDIGSVVRLKVDGGGFTDATAIRFHQDATVNFDGKFDAHKLFSSPGYVGYPGVYTKRTSISTKSGNDDYSVNSLPYAHTADAVIPVLVKVYASGQHTITGSGFENLPNSCVILKDKLDNSTHDLKTSPYVCNINDTTSTPRFELRVCMDVTMNVDETKAGIAADKSILINNDENGVYVKFDYDKATKSNISVTNILGQRVIDDKSLTTVNDKVYLNLDPKQQLIFVTVSTDTKKVTKKVIR